MKKALLLSLVLLYAIFGISQNQALKSGLKTEKAPWLKTTMQESDQAVYHPKPEINIPADFKNTDVVNIVTLGTCGNAYGMGYAGQKRKLLDYNQELNAVTFIHFMGGALDPAGNTRDFGYDISLDGGETWTTMIELYVSPDTTGGYITEIVGYPQGEIFNPPGNTNPDEAYIAYQATVAATMPGGQDGFVFGRGKIGDITDTTRNFIYSNPDLGIYLSKPEGFTLDNNGRMWMVNYNQNWDNGGMEWLQEIVVTQCVWNESENDFETGSQFLLDCPSEFRPADVKIEFSPDGTFGYIFALGDIGDVPVSDGLSYYPIIWRTEDSGETWEGPSVVPLAGENGITGVQYFLNNDELAEIYGTPIPPRDEIPFTTAFDFDLTVDAIGNPHIAVVVGITGEDPYSIITDISPSSGYLYTAAMLLSSFDLGEPGSWEAGVMGRLVSFRGSFGDLTEDNRIQIARTVSGEQLFVSWLDTDSTVSNENNAPDIWCRGVDLITQRKTANDNGEDLPSNVTFGSEATFSAYFFNGSREVMDDDNWHFTIPYVYQNMTPTDPYQPVEYRYIQDFNFSAYDFQIPAYLTVGMEEPPVQSNFALSVSGPSPNPAKESVSIRVNVHESSGANIRLTNLTGQTVQHFTQNLNAGNNTIAIDVSDLNSGIYFLTVEAGGEAVSKKLIVNR
ncbi:MAG: T9SS type A sorting domain-containing protein [Bacteroidales bacterium]|nr:T9SS type A sorting domain-containing protein [Bacteroidales bacterium]